MMCDRYIKKNPDPSKKKHYKYSALNVHCEHLEKDRLSSFCCME